MAEGGGTGGWRSRGWTRRWPRSRHGRHGQHRGSDRAADEWAPVVSYFSELSKRAQTSKWKMDALPCSKNSQILYAARIGHYEQFFNCADIQIAIELELKILKQIHHLNL
jgi:hypothetical protein